MGIKFNDIEKAKEFFKKNGFDVRELQEQLNFFDYIYPRISSQLDSLEKSQKSLNNRILCLEEERKYLLEHITQYKKKIQRIEQFLIENGLIKLLGKKLT